MEPQEIVALAISKEAEAEALYSETAGRIDDLAARVLLKELAAEEAQHRRLLEGLDPAKIREFQVPRARDAMIAEHLQARPLTGRSSLQDVMVYAMQREQKAGQFYETMAASVRNRDLAQLLLNLAAMEMTHKARLEEFYEEVFLSED
jgi:rubrerythrin